MAYCATFNENARHCSRRWTPMSRRHWRIPNGCWNASRRIIPHNGAASSLPITCAAPGGKACHILETQPQLATLVAIDSDGERMRRVTDNLQRLGLQAKSVI